MQGAAEGILGICGGRHACGVLVERLECVRIEAVQAAKEQVDESSIDDAAGEILSGHADGGAPRGHVKEAKMAA